MKKTKYLAVLAMAILSSFALLPSTGCKTTATGQTVVDTNLVDNIAVVIRNASRTAAVMAIEDDPGMRRWFDFAQAAIGVFLTGQDYSPQAFMKALEAVPVKEVKEKWVKLAIGTAVDVYEVYWSKYVRGKIANNYIAIKFLTAVQAGFAQAATPPPNTSN